jgi:predicted transcriptional regulator
MAAEVKKEIQLEIAHVLFTDIVGYSKLPIHQQRAVVERLNEIVRAALVLVPFNHVASIKRAKQSWRLSP